MKTISTAVAVLLLLAGWSLDARYSYPAQSQQHKHGKKKHEDYGRPREAGQYIYRDAGVDQAATDQAVGELDEHAEQMNEATYGSSALVRGYNSPTGVVGNSTSRSHAARAHPR